MNTPVHQVVAEQKRLRKLVKQLRAAIVATAIAESSRTKKSAKRFQNAAAELAGAASDSMVQLLEEQQKTRRIYCENKVFARPPYSSKMEIMPACENAESHGRFHSRTECCGLCRPKSAKGC